MWLARDEQTGRTCAMRLADGTGHNIFELAARYRAEVDVIERIRCENVLDILDYGDWNEMPYLVVEHLEGEDLAARLRREGHLSPELAYRVLAQTARALARAHTAGIVHGDVTPEHILIAQDGMQSIAKVYNFSLTQRASEVSVGTVTKMGTFLRLPYYESPEQAAGKAFDWRSDLWSLGVLGYECLTGRRPFESAVFGDLVAQILCDPIPQIKLPDAETPAPLRAWWEKACTRDPEKRFQSAKQLSDALGQAFDFPIVFVPEGAFGTGAVATSPVPSGTEESRVGVRTKSKSKRARLATQIGLGGGKAKVRMPVPPEPRLDVPAPARASVDVEVPLPARESIDVEVPASARESIDVEMPASARQSVDVEMPLSAPQSTNLPEDLFAGFQVTEAPTLSFRQAAVPAVNVPDSDPLAIQLKRKKALRKFVVLTLAVMLALIALPLTRKVLAKRHATSQARSGAPAVAAGQSRGAPQALLTNGVPAIQQVSGSSEVAPDTVPAISHSADVASAVPTIPELTAGADVAPLAAAMDSTTAASKANAAAENRGTRLAGIGRSRVSKSSAPTTPPSSRPRDKAAAETPPAAPKQKSKAQATTRDYGI